MDPEIVVSDDDDFEADMKAAEQQQKQKQIENSKDIDPFGANVGEQEVFDETVNSNKNIASVHKQYNTDIVSGGLSAKKKKKKRSRANKTAIVGNEDGLNTSENFGDPNGEIQKGEY